jgi:CheY-like chemotaxis protein
VVLCDIGLPGAMDGYGVARALRAAPGTPSVYLIALTGYGQDDDRRRALEAGFDAHLTKPADLDALHRLLAGAGPP